MDLKKKKGSYRRGFGERKGKGKFCNKIESQEIKEIILIQKSRS